MNPITKYYQLIKQIMYVPSKKKSQETVSRSMKNTIESRLEGHKYFTYQDLDKTRKEIKKYNFCYN